MMSGNHHAICSKSPSRLGTPETIKRAYRNQEPVGVRWGGRLATQYSTSVLDPSRPGKPMNVQAPPRPNGTLGRQDLGLGPRKRLALEILEAYPGLNLDEVALALGVQRT